MTRAVVITVSDRVSAGEMADRSGPALAALLAGAGHEVSSTVVPDEPERIARAIVEAAAEAALVLTTGGTGLAARDVTPQATRPLLDYEVPGLAEEMRRAGVRSTPLAVLSRGIAGVRGRTLVVNLPGSERGAVESMESIVDAIGHALRLLAGDTGH